MKKYCIYNSLYEADGDFKKSLIRIESIQESAIDVYDLEITKGVILISEEEVFKDLEGVDNLFIGEIDYVFEAENDEEAKLIFEVMKNE